MSTIHTLSRRGLPDLVLEDFGSAVLCGGTVFPWENVSIAVYTDSRCWGYEVSVPAGAYVRTSAQFDRSFILQERGCSCTIAHPGDRVEIIRVLNSDPLCLECERWYGRDAADQDDEPRPLEADFTFHEEDGFAVIDGCDDDLIDLLIPPVLSGLPVSRAELGPLPWSCETLIVSNGVQALDAHFNHRLTRLELPESLTLLTPPHRIGLSRWFRTQPNEPVYLNGWYCGTPGRGVGGITELVLRDGTIGIAEAADCRCCWHRIHIPDSVTYIGDYAFASAPCLEELRLPRELSYLGTGAFQSCDRLQRLRLPDELTAPIRAFGLCQHLREVSMPASCWSESGHAFPSCPSILLRDGSSFRLISRDVSPSPVTGTLRAYPQDSPITAAGREYAGIEEIVCKKMPGSGNFRDRYGNRVLHFYWMDEGFYTSEGPYCEQRWYMTGPDGLTEIELDDMQRSYMVHDGITLPEVPRHFRKRVEEYFFKDRPKD